jgi:3D (Asp-Asp-Asp) domain-containing protein
MHSLTALALAITIMATAYDAPCRICGTRSKTITGRSTRHPGVASRRWPVGTVLYIQGIGRRVVDDRCKGALDIRFTGPGAHKRAKAFGHRKVKVRVLKAPRKQAKH